ncbi:Rio2, N-terminal-domain-containing protein [Xylaria bambusicola]|uniref:Rio2, N-terminal-domain-containing protein n=1 Tax=Xylaria bambusicola TaxID=326684 RepID=UPI002007D238|nr:Rio2, N-terminal-domain-containing protein [Xylaria bambusicola]KAI0520917.1 Rio2, N-terminal-domain-containing protein [Xylaria bambusicola]
MKLDSKAMRHLTAEDWRVLTAVEIGSKNHEVVPTPLIESISKLRGGAGRVHHSISALAKVGLIARMKEARYDGYRLTYGGLDYLALHTYASQRAVYSVGNQIGVGKESDILVVADEAGVQHILKIHRLGRISFRTVKANRDYLRKRQGGSWMYLSRLAAEREYAFMRALKEEGFLVPEPLSQSRHTILMSLVDAFPLRQIASVPDPALLYAELIALILRLAKHGLIHGDFNEFNILIKEEPIQNSSDSDAEQNQTSSKGKEVERHPDPEATPESSGEKEEIKITPVLIDFPQMVSMDHANAEMYFDRDVACVKRFFERRFHFVSTQPGPFFKDAKKTVGKDGARRLDAAVEASGFSKKALKDLEAAIREQQEARGPEGEQDDSSVDDEDEDNDDDDDGENDHSGNEENSIDNDQETDNEPPKTGTSRDDLVNVSISKLAIGDAT